MSNDVTLIIILIMMIMMSRGLVIAFLAAPPVIKRFCSQTLVDERFRVQFPIALIDLAFRSLPMVFSA